METRVGRRAMALPSEQQAVACLGACAAGEGAHETMAKAHTVGAAPPSRLLTNKTTKSGGRICVGGEKHDDNPRMTSLAYLKEREKRGRWKTHTIQQLPTIFPLELIKPTLSPLTILLVILAAPSMKHQV